MQATRFTVFAIIFFWILSAHASSNHQVVAVVDGDTIKVMNQGKAEKIRLAFIDAPEMNQPFGQKSKQALSGLIYNQTVSLERFGQDKYGRTLAVVYHGGENVNLSMVKFGYAWVYTRYTDDQLYFDAQQVAQEKKHGLWSLPAQDQMPPWEWRRQEGQHKAH